MPKAGPPAPTTAPLPSPTPSAAPPRSTGAVGTAPGTVVGARSRGAGLAVPRPTGRPSPPSRPDVGGAFGLRGSCTKPMRSAGAFGAGTRPNSSVHRAPIVAAFVNSTMASALTTTDATNDDVDRRRPPLPESPCGPRLRESIRSGYPTAATGSAADLGVVGVVSAPPRRRPRGWRPD